MNYKTKKNQILKEIRKINKFYESYKYSSLSESETRGVEELRQKEISAALSTFTPEQWEIFQNEELQKYWASLKKNKF